uniref:NADH-ubiquinone oxidoreductase chain 6 n=2 Tax=Pylaiella littoralis TaxID=2885 RepID=Q94YZ2_PYLLI|nr:NADH dehydrogenase subunit 6 [Pylaiella littoralis]CAC50855.1 NADH dehydrogenase subunit 6 [Pylaiella littoralis]
MVDHIIFLIITTLGVGLGIKVTSTQNPVYSGLYLVLLFFLGSGIAFLLGLEFIALLFLLVYAGAIAVLVLFVVMMLDIKAIENPWSSKKISLVFYPGSLVLFCCLGWSYNVKEIGFLPSFTLSLCKEKVESLYSSNNMWFVEFDSSCALNDPSYLLYSTYAILLIIAGVILLIAMVGAISLTLQKKSPESLYRQLGRESKHAVFSIKEKVSYRLDDDPDTLP